LALPVPLKLVGPSQNKVMHIYTDFTSKIS
jgi:hypothetical protein